MDPMFIRILYLASTNKQTLTYMSAEHLCNDPLCERIEEETNSRASYYFDV
jgi:hypothetical protein